METVTATELHDRTSQLTEQAMRDPERPIVVEKHGKAAVVLVDARYFEGLIETLDLLSDPSALKQLRDGLEDERAGRVMSFNKLMEELGLDERKTGRSRNHRKRGSVASRNR